MSWERATPVALFSSQQSAYERHWSAALPASSLLRNAPQHDHRVGHDPLDTVGAIGERRVPLAEGNEHDVVHGARLQGGGNLLAFVLAASHAEGVAQLLDLGIARPAEQALVAGRTDPGVQHRIGRTAAGRGGDEDVPAALRGRLLLGPA